MLDSYVENHRSLLDRPAIQMPIVGGISPWLGQKTFQASNQEFMLLIFCLLVVDGVSKNCLLFPDWDEGSSSKLPFVAFGSQSYKLAGRSEFRSMYSLFWIAF